MEEATTSGRVGDAVEFGSELDVVLIGLVNGANSDVRIGSEDETVGEPVAEVERVDGGADESFVVELGACAPASGTHGYVRAARPTLDNVSLTFLFAMLLQPEGY